MRLRFSLYELFCHLFDEMLQKGKKWKRKILWICTTWVKLWRRERNQDLCGNFWARKRRKTSCYSHEAIKQCKQKNIKSKREIMLNTTKMNSFKTKSDFYSRAIHRFCPSLRYKGFSLKFLYWTGYTWNGWGWGWFVGLILQDEKLTLVWCLPLGL